jgi:hypothetical protein
LVLAQAEGQGGSPQGSSRPGEAQAKRGALASGERLVCD